MADPEDPPLELLQPMMPPDPLSPAFEPLVVSSIKPASSPPSTKSPRPLSASVHAHGAATTTTSNWNDDKAPTAIKGHH
jgi:hypothetical protein